MRRPGPLQSKILNSIPLTFAISTLIVISGGATGARAQMPEQRPAGYVSDFAGVLSQAGRQRLESLCKELDEKTHAQLAIVTVKSLQGKPLEEFSIGLATKWGIGYKGGPRDEKIDRGILLLLAIDEHQDRIEVGYGLESIINDGRAGGILRSMVPYLRAGDYDGAVWLAAASIASPIANEYGVTLAALAGGPVAAPEQTESPDNTPWFVFLVPILFLIIFSILARRRGRRGPGGYYRGGGGGWGGGFGGGIGGGGFGSGGGGGGGFGGFGGGSFGGGGASGSW